MTRPDDLMALSRRVDALEQDARAHELEQKRSAQAAESRRYFRRTILLAIVVPLALLSIFIGGYLVGRFGHPH